MRPVVLRGPVLVVLLLLLLLLLLASPSVGGEIPIYSKGDDTSLRCVYNTGAMTAPSKEPVSI